MSRHRNIRTQNYDDYDDTDEYGKSFEEEIGVSPGTVSQFMYRRDDPSKNANRPPTLIEEDHLDGEDELMEEPHTLTGDAGAWVPDSEIDQGRMKSCIDYIDSCTGDAYTRDQVKRAVLSANYNAERALQLLLDHEGNVPNVPPVTKPPLPLLAKKLESLSVTQDGSSFTGIALKEPDRKCQKLMSDAGEVRKVATYDDPTISSRDSVTKLKLSSVKLPEWALNFVSDANQRYTSMAEKMQPSPADIHLSVVNSFAVSGDKRMFPRPESTPNLRLLDPGRSMPGTPTPGSPKATRKGSKGGGFPLRTASRAEDSQGDAGTANAKTPEVPFAPTRSLIKITALYEQRQSSSKPLINLIVIGHVDAGKSTLMGHLLYLLGKVDAKQMAKFEHEAKKIGKSSFMYAWVLDETGEERARGVTIDVAQTSFETVSKVVNLMDAPGHKDFIPNMITGTAQADVAVLVVDATRGEFETGFQSGGQTREHTLLARSLGVAQLVVAVNKMDTVDWSQERFDQIVQILAPFFKAVGFKDADVSFVPCSGFTGDNLTSPPKNAETARWWTGPTLVERIDNFRPPIRQIDKPYRQIITDVFKSLTGGFSVAGKIEAGHIQTGDRVTIMPAGVSGVVKTITMDSGAALNAFAGDNVIVALTGVDILNVHVGDILCDPTSPVPVASRLRARIALFTPKVPMLAGQECVFHNQAYTESCVVKKLISQINRNTGEIQKKNPRMLTKNTSGVIEISLQRPVCAELYSVSRELGRFMLRDSGTTIAAGVITEILS